MKWISIILRDMCHTHHTMHDAIMESILLIECRDDRPHRHNMDCEESGSDRCDLAEVCPCRP